MSVPIVNSMTSLFSPGWGFRSQPPSNRSGPIGEYQRIPNPAAYFSASLSHGQSPCLQVLPVSKNRTPLNPISLNRGKRYSTFATNSLFPPIRSPVFGSVGEMVRDLYPRMVYGPPRKNRSKIGTLPPTVLITCPHKMFPERTVDV